MSLHPGVRNLVLLLVATTAYGHLIRPLGPYVGSEAFYYLLNKGLLAVLLLGAWLLTGFYRVDEAERGVVQRFGAYTETTLPGLRWLRQVSTASRTAG